MKEFEKETWHKKTILSSDIIKKKVTDLVSSTGN